MEKLTTWHEFLIGELANREEAMSYLQVSLEEYLIDGDTPFFLKGLRNVVEAQGGIDEIAKQAGIASKVLSEFLYNEDMFALGTLSTILKVFGWQLSIEPLATEIDKTELASEPLTTAKEPLARASVEQAPESL